MLFSNIFEYFQPSLFQRCTTKIHSFSPPKSFRCTSGFRVLAARPPRGCVGRSATGVTPSRRPWCNRVEGFWVSACFWGERNNIRLNMVKLHYITLHYIHYLLYFTLHYITYVTYPVGWFSVILHSTCCDGYARPWLGHIPLQRMAGELHEILHGRVLKLQHKCHGVPPESDISGSLIPGFTVLMFYH